MNTGGATSACSNMPYAGPVELPGASHDTLTCSAQETASLSLHLGPLARP